MLLFWQLCWRRRTMYISHLILIWYSYALPIICEEVEKRPDRLADILTTQKDANIITDNTFCESIGLQSRNGSLDQDLTCKAWKMSAATCTLVQTLFYKRYPEKCIQYYHEICHIKVRHWFNLLKYDILR